VSVLRIAHRLDFPVMRAFALKQLEDITSSVDKIVLAHEFGIDAWLKPAYVCICTSQALVSDDEIDRLGFNLFKKVARARNRLSSMPAEVPSERAKRVVEDEFDLVADEPLRAVSPGLPGASTAPASIPDPPQPAPALASEPSGTLGGAFGFGGGSYGASSVFGTAYGAPHKKEKK
jgi:hypothetical protein